MDTLSTLPKKHILTYSIIGSLLSTIIPIMVAIDHMREGNFFLRIIDISVLFLLVIFVFYTSIWLNLKWEKMHVVKLISLNVFVLIAISIFSITIHMPIWERTTRIPIAFYIRDEFVRNTTIFIVSYLASKFYKKSIEYKNIKNAFDELSKENLTHQVRVLMQQINPHFFFNSLNTLSGLVQESPEKSEIFIDKLSQVFRYVLKMQENNKARLCDELKFAEDYFYLLKMRFEDKIFLNQDVKCTGDEFIAPLSTQLLIENVIKHNRIIRQFPVTITIEVQQNYLIVSNSFYPQKNVISSGFGLKNLNKRCELLCEKSIIIEKSENVFCVKVPLFKIES